MPDDRISGDHPVGYAHPPREHRFKKGTSGNPRGRPKSKIAGQTAISELLNEPIKVRAGGKSRDMSAFEASLRQLVSKALNGDIRAILKFVKLCEQYDVIAPPPAATGGGIVRAPKGVDFHDWLESVTEEVPIDQA